MSIKFDAGQLRTYDSGYDYAYGARCTDHRCSSGSDASEAPSEDSDNSSAAPPRRFRASQKNIRSRNNKLRTLNRWTTEEHDKLAYLVEKWGSEKNWAKVAEEMPGRTGKQCRERWLNHMKPGIVKGNWSAEEEFLLAQCHALVGSHWSKMTKRLPGRTENSIKNFWNATLRSKAPNKKRGMLWTYMQLHDPKAEDNTMALIATINRLHETRELPPHLLAQLDAHMLDSRIWKAIHKAEKDFLESAGGELHYLALPHAAAGAMAAPMQAYGSSGAVASMSPSPVVSAVPHHNFSHSMVPGAAYLQSSGMGMEAGHAVMLADASHTVAGALSHVGLDNYLLSAQDPLLGCVPDTMDQDLLKVLGEAQQQHQVAACCPPNPVSNSTADTGPASFGSMNAVQVLAPCSESATAVDDVGLLEHKPAHCQQVNTSSSTQSTALEQCSMAATSGLHTHSSQIPVTDAPTTAAAPVELSHCEDRSARPQPGTSQYLTTVSMGQQHQLQQLGMDAAGFAMQQMKSAPVDEFITPNSAATMASRSAGGHGPHCRCGPCSNSRRLHGLHSPGARRNTRLSSNVASNQASAVQYGRDSSKASYLQPPKLQQLSGGTEVMGAAAGWEHHGTAIVPQRYAYVMGQVAPQSHQNTYMLDQQLAAQHIDYTHDIVRTRQQLPSQPVKPGGDAQSSSMQHSTSDWGQLHAGGLQNNPAPSHFDNQHQQLEPEKVDCKPHHTAELEVAPWHGGNMQQGQQEAAPQQQQHHQEPAASGQLQQHGNRLGLGCLNVPGLASDAVTGLLLSPLGLLSPMGGLMMPTSTRPFKLPSFGQISIMRPSITGGEWDWDALLLSEITHNPREQQNGAGAESKNAAASALPYTQTAKRPRSSFNSGDDDAALLIDMHPAKIARSLESHVPPVLCSSSNAVLRDFLNRFD